jgi:hypothetical protein
VGKLLDCAMKSILKQVRWQEGIYHFNKQTLQLLQKLSSILYLVLELPKKSNLLIVPSCSRKPLIPLNRRPQTKVPEKTIYLRDHAFNYTWSSRKLRGFASAHNKLQEMFAERY